MIWDVLVWLLVFAGNMVVGALFWVLVDDEQQSFFRWYAVGPAAVSDRLSSPAA